MGSYSLQKWRQQTTWVQITSFFLFFNWSLVWGRGQSIWSTDFQKSLPTTLDVKPPSLGKIQPAGREISHNAWKSCQSLLPLELTEKVQQVLRVKGKRGDPARVPLVQKLSQFPLWVSRLSGICQKYKVISWLSRWMHLFQLLISSIKWEPSHRWKTNPEKNW